MLFLTKPSASQDSCLPRYDLPVQTVMLQNVQVAYVEKGTGTPLLLVHGLGGNLSHWQKAVHLLSGKYRCIAIDLPGYGHSLKAFDTQGRDQLQFYADILIEFIQRKRLKSVLLAGHSMGAQVAVIAALQSPGSFKKLAMVAPAGLEIFTAGEAALLIGATPAAFFEKQDETLIRSSFARNFLTMPPDAEALIGDRLRLRGCREFSVYTAAVSNGVKGMLAHPVFEQLNRLRQPVLVLFGDDDKLIPNTFLHKGLTLDTLLKRTALVLNNHQAVRVPRAGHLVQFEKPNEVATALKNFFR